MRFPQCVYNDDTVNGFENCEYKIIHSIEEFNQLPSNWGKKQRIEWGLKDESSTSNEVEKTEEKDAESSIDGKLDDFHFPEDVKSEKPKRRRSKSKE